MTIDRQLVKEDLYQAVNGDWLKIAVIPNDKSRTGGFSVLADELEETMMAEVDQMLAGNVELEDEALLEFVKLYRLALDQDSRTKIGVREANEILDWILKAEDYENLQDRIDRMIEMGWTSPFRLSVSPDLKSAKDHALYLDVPDLILPDTAYYQAANKKGQSLLATYEKQSQALLEKYGYPSETAELLVQLALELDKAFAQKQKSREALADYTKQYNPRPSNEVIAYFNNLNLDAIITGLIGFVPENIIVTQVEFFEAWNSFFKEDGFKKLQAWLLVRVANDLANILSEEIRQLASQYSLALSGNPEVQSFKKHAYYQVKQVFSQPVGMYYGKKYFGPKAKEDVQEMVDQMIKVYQDRLNQNDWLSPETIEKAIQKLAAFEVLVGYPESYPAYYSYLKVDSDQSYFKNFCQLQEIIVTHHFEKMGKKVDRTEWHMPADMVNAYYSPSGNLICFPAAILQPPFYSLDQSRSQNYGGIGAVIAHEISHAFDNNGAKMDADGNINNWWTEEDFRSFEAKAQAMIDQWDGIPYRQGSVNGRLTVSENIADCGGLTAALQALKHESDYQVDEFFYNWARIWCQKARPEFEAMLLQIDVHAPAELRANIQVRNLDEFHQEFATKEGDSMYLAPEKRVRIW